MTVRRDERSARAEVQAWYLDGLRPKLVDAARAGAVGVAAAQELDRRVRELLDLPGDEAREAA